MPFLKLERGLKHLNRGMDVLCQVGTPRFRSNFLLPEMRLNIVCSLNFEDL